MPKVLNRHHGNVPKGAVYVGRGTRWGNPFLIGEHGTREQVLRQFHSYIMASPTLIRRARKQLKGRSLVCSCNPGACHADVLLAIANDWPLPSWLAQQQLELPMT